MPRGFGGGRSNSGGRSSSSGGSSRSYGSSSRSSNQARPQPSQAQQAPSQRPGMFGGGGGLGSTLATGMAFGGGSAIGHSVVRSMMGGSGQHSQSQTPMEQQNQNGNSVNPSEAGSQQLKNPCMDFNFKFIDCLKTNGNEIQLCQSLFDDLKVCEKNII